MDENPFEPPQSEGGTRKKQPAPSTWYILLLLVPPVLLAASTLLTGFLADRFPSLRFIGFLGMVGAVVIAWRVCDRLTGKSPFNMFVLFLGDLCATKFVIELVAMATKTIAR